MSLLTPVLLKEDTVLRGMSHEDIKQRLLPMDLISKFTSERTECFDLSNESIMLQEVLEEVGENNPYMTTAVMCELILNCLYSESMWRESIDFSSAFCRNYGFKRNGKVSGLLDSLTTSTSKKLSRRFSRNATIFEWGIFSVNGIRLVDDTYEYTVDLLGDYRVKEWEYQNQDRTKRSGHLKEARG